MGSRHRAARRTASPTPRANDASAASARALSCASRRCRSASPGAAFEVRRVGGRQCRACAKPSGPRPHLGCDTMAPEMRRRRCATELGPRAAPTKGAHNGPSQHPSTPPPSYTLTIERTTPPPQLHTQLPLHLPLRLQLYLHRQTPERELRANLWNEGSICALSRHVLNRPGCRRCSRLSSVPPCKLRTASYSRAEFSGSARTCPSSGHTSKHAYRNAQTNKHADHRAAQPSPRTRPARPQLPRANLSEGRICTTQCPKATSLGLSAGGPELDGGPQERQKVNR